ncbi:MAG: helix-turn-helix transcriptional regulator [Bacteroidales bacterium]|nr:helix-turn-helix transcriptional regulator [Bacteroidales bacterium]
MQNIGEQIKRRRKMLGISQRQFSAIAEVGINTLTKIERGEANPTVEVLSRILSALGMELTISVKQPES